MQNRTEYLELEVTHLESLSSTPGSTKHHPKWDIKTNGWHQEKN